MRLFLVLLASGLLLGGVKRDADACCMVPASYAGTIGQSAQEGVLFHHDGWEELVLKINYQISGASPPDRFAWVITVPSEPTKYSVANAELFQELFDWASLLVAPPALPTRTLGQANDSDGLYLSPPVVVGPYEIQPVRALGKKALLSLNNWLKENGFPTEDPGHMKYFVENAFTFLCVKVSPRASDATVAQEGGVPPLHLSFASKAPYYPLRFSLRQGVFDVNLYVFTKRSFDYRASSGSLSRMNWHSKSLRQNVKVSSEVFPAKLGSVYGKSRFSDDPGTWYLNVIRTRETNKGNAIAKWTTDIFFRTQG